MSSKIAIGRSERYKARATRDRARPGGIASKRNTKYYTRQRGEQSVCIFSYDEWSRQPALAESAGIHIFTSLIVIVVVYGQITDAAFVHLHGIHTLSMQYCENISNAALIHLVGIKKLETLGCRRLVCMDAAFLLGVDYVPDVGEVAEEIEDENEDD